MSRTCLPDFLVIGAARAGTTSLYRYLKSHPQIYLSPIKEPKYFAYPETRPTLVGPRRNSPLVWKIEDYRRLFQARAGEIAAGEMSPQYLYSECAPAAIRRLIPQAKLIAILRDPAERAFSHFCHNRSGGVEPLSDFAAALAAEDERMAQGWWSSFHYRHRGYYARQLNRYLKLFPREQILVLLYDDMLADCHAFLRRICAFLGIDESHKFDTTERDNATVGIPRSPILRRFLRSAGPAKSTIRTALPLAVRSRLFRWFSRLVLQPRPVLQPGVRAQLVSGFRPEILELQECICRDLSGWLRC
ncbi:MAG TPA: sulfotransferase [Bryobacteraceae bacterium]|nr:sulfotransferase [Bryobacteraceae bacterium]